MVDRLLRERALGAEIADLQRLLLRQASGHDFAEPAHQHLVRKRPVVAVHQPPKHLLLALGAVVLDRRGQLALGRADLAIAAEHTSELQTLMRISYSAFCLKQKKTAL